MIIRMVYGAGLLLLLNLAFVQMAFSPDKDCDFVENIPSKQLISFQNPHWPATYMSGSTCRWTFECPMWFACRLRCLDVGLPQTDDCYMDKLLVSGAGNSDLEGAHVFCGRAEINFRSVGSRMTLALIASKVSPGGRFRCTINSEPWVQPWLVSPSTPNPELLEQRGSTLTETESTQLSTKIMTPTQDNGYSRKDDRISTGLIQSRVSLFEPERVPHAKDEKPDPSRSKYIDEISSQPKYMKLEPPYTGQMEDEALLSNQIQVDPITAKRPGKTRLPLTKNYKVGFTNANRIKVNDSPFADRPEEESPIIEIVQPEPSYMKPVNTGLSIDKRVHRRADMSRKQKIRHLSSHIRRAGKGARRVKKLQGRTRHVRHGLMRAPKVNNNKQRTKGRMARITYRTGMPHTRRVRTQLKRTTKRPTIPPYIRGHRSNNGQALNLFL